MALFYIFKTRYHTEPKNRKIMKLEYAPMSNVMATLQNIGGALCSTPQSLAVAHY